MHRASDLAGGPDSADPADRSTAYPEGWGTSPSSFRWAVGIENTFVPQTAPGHRRLDEFELLGHDRLWREDIDRAADLGISTIRQGIPWYKVNPEPGRWDWSWTDEVLEYLVTAKNLTPIVDLVHFGTPLWLDNEFINASYPHLVAEYASRFAERYASLVRCYTPVNEPSVTAKFCGRDGRWPPYLKGDDGYVKVLLAVIKGLNLAAEAIRSARPDAVLVHVEDLGLERARSRELDAIAELRQEWRFLALDLACGRVVPGHSWFDWLLGHGTTPGELIALAGSSPRWDVLGVNYYPWSSRRLVRRRDGQVRDVGDPSPSGLADVLRLTHDRYGLPLMVTETSANGSWDDRARWMAATFDAVRRARAGGVPVVGYTWFPLFTMIEWKYRWSRRRPEDHLLHLGLYDVHLGGRFDRESTPLVDAYRDLIASGHLDQVEPDAEPAPYLVA